MASSCLMKRKSTCTCTIGSFTIKDMNQQVGHLEYEKQGHAFGLRIIFHAMDSRWYS
jgi:hypothetical protein